MQFRTIGGLEVSVAGLGCNNFGWTIGQDETKAVVDAALEAGMNHFDTADGYGGGQSEALLALALGSRRDSVMVTTKFGAYPTPDGIAPGSATWARECCEASLRRLGTDYIDLYLLHYPDPATPIGETLAALAELKAGGKVREIGCSNLMPTQLDAAADAARDLGIDGFVALQSSYSLLDRTAEAELLPACERHGIAFVPYFPLASGMLTGKYRRGAPLPDKARLAGPFGSNVPGLQADECFDIVERLEAYAGERGHTLVELALSWLAAVNGVASVVTGARTPEQARTNAAATTSWKLTEAEWSEVTSLTIPDIAFTVHPRSPEYAKAPAGMDPRTG